MIPDWNVDPSTEKRDPLVFDHMRAYKVRKGEELENMKSLPERERLKGLVERLYWALKASPGSWVFEALLKTAEKELGLDSTSGVGVKAPGEPGAER
jgi:hypothetical protein